MENLINRSVLLFSCAILIYFGCGLAHAAPYSANQALNQYYQQLKMNPVQAKQALLAAYKKYPNNIQINQELGYLFLREKNNQAALKYFKNTYRLNPRNEKTQLQLAYIYKSLGNEQKSKVFFSALTKSQDSAIKKQAMLELDYLSSAAKKVSKKTPKTPQVKQSQTFAGTTGVMGVSAFDYKMNQYYSVKRRNPKAAEKLLYRIARRYPSKRVVIKEMAYTTLANEQYEKSLHYFLKWQRFEPSNDRVKLQIAYLYDKLHLYKKAYRQFEIVAKSKDSKIAQIACQALANLASYRYKFLPHPWFADLYYAPIWRGRFRNLIHPVKFRFGAQLGEHNQTEVYGFVRYTRDTRSAGGTIPDIYEDNAAIFGVGISFRPFIKVPMYWYAELGRAYDLIDRNRSRWQRDFRVGATGYQRWGRGDFCVPGLHFPFKQVGDFYGDVSFYSRFDDDIIGQFRVRQGLRVLEWGKSSVNAYLKGQYFFDTNYEFYNNVFEFGPGISLKPYNRLPIVLRVERLRSQYVPVSSPSPRPYKSNHYVETRVEAELYLRV